MQPNHPRLARLLYRPLHLRTNFAQDLSGCAQVILPPPFPCFGARRCRLLSVCTHLGRRQPRLAHGFLQLPAVLRLLLLGRSWQEAADFGRKLSLRPFLLTLLLHTLAPPSIPSHPGRGPRPGSACQCQLPLLPLPLPAEGACLRNKSASSSSFTSPRHPPTSLPLTPQEAAKFVGKAAALGSVSSPAMQAAAAPAVGAVCRSAGIRPEELRELSRQAVLLLGVSCHGACVGLCACVVARLPPCVPTRAIPACRQVWLLACCLTSPCSWATSAGLVVGACHLCERCVNLYPPQPCQPPIRRAVGRLPIIFNSTHLPCAAPNAGPAVQGSHRV